MTLSAELKQNIEKTLAENQVVLFMKGTAENPMCGFSARAATLLQRMEITFRDINILEDEELRQGLKEYGNWPTFPQLYVEGELIGGADIMVEMAQSGELEELLQAYRKS